MTLSTKPAPFGKKCRAYGVGPECRRDREANHNPCPASDDDRSGRLLAAILHQSDLALTPSH